MWARAWDFYYSNRTALNGLIALVVTAGVKTMPAPGTAINLRTLYTWAFDFGHQFLNISNPRLDVPAMRGESVPLPKSQP